MDRKHLAGTLFALSTFVFGGPAFAQCVASDTLQLGDRAPVSICEGVTEGIYGQVVSDAIYFSSPIALTAPISQDLQVTLTEPGSTAVSDYINIDPIVFGSDFSTIYGLNVTLVSDNETPLNVSYGDYVLAETGAPQNLDPYIREFYHWDFALPAVWVTSDVSDVPEPATWAMMLGGFCALGLLGYRGTRRASAAA